MSPGAETRPLLIIGGRSQVGCFLRRRLAGMRQPAVAVSRQPGSDTMGWHWLQAELPDAMPGLPPLAGIVSAGPLGPLAEWLAGQPDLDCPLVVATSSMSALSKRDSPVVAEQALASALTQAEQRLQAVCEAQGRAWTILRPTLIFGAGLDRSLSPIARRAARWRVFPLPPGRGLRQPVHADDVAAALLACRRTESAWGQIIPCGGGERLPAAEMFARVWRSLPGPVLPMPVPAMAVKISGWLMPARAGMLSRLEADLVADNHMLRTRLGLQPRGFHPGAGDWWPSVVVAPG